MRSRTSLLLILLALLIILLYAYGAEPWSDHQQPHHVSLTIETPQDPFPYPMDVAELLDSTYLDVLVRSLDRARSTIEVSMFMAQVPRGECAKILAALIRARHRGIRVRALFDDRVASNRTWVSFLTASGIDARLDSPETKLHDKAVLIDGGIFIVGSHNWSNAALTQNREASLYVIAEPAAFLTWQERFSRAWEEGEDLGPETGQPVFNFAAIRAVSTGSSPPTEHVRGRIVVDGDYIRASEQMIDLMRDTFMAAMYYVSLDVLKPGRPLSRFFDRLRNLASRHAATMVLDQMDRDDRELDERDNTMAITYLEERGIKASYDAESITHHVKAIVIDGRYILLGSHNWTISSTSYNRETSLLIDAPLMGSRIDAYIRDLEKSGRVPGRTTPVERQENWVPMETLIQVH